MAIRAFFSGPIARATILSLTIRLASIALLFLQAVVTARILGPEGYGVVAYVVALTMILATLALFGTEQLAVREVARMKAVNEGGRLLGFLRAIMWLVIGASVILAVVFAVLAPRLQGNDQSFNEVMTFAVLIFPIVALTLQSQGIMSGFGQVAMAVIPFQIIRPAVLLLIMLAAWALTEQAGPQHYLYALLLASVVSLIAARWAVHRQRKGVSAAIETLAMPGVARGAIPFFAFSLMTLVLSELSTLMLAWWSTPEQTGLFQPIARIAPLIMLGAQAAAVRYAARMSELFAKGEIARLTAITHIFTLTTMGFAVVAALIVILFGETILGLFGRAFTANVVALYWVVGAQILSSMCGPAGIVVSMSNRAGLTVWPHVLALAISLIVGMLTIPQHGATGAAYAMSAGIVMRQFGMFWMVRRHLGFDPSVIGAIARMVHR